MKSAVDEISEPKEPVPFKLCDGRCDLKFLCRNNFVGGFSSMFSGGYVNCDIYYWNKMRNLSFGYNGWTISNDVLELVHTNVNGPHNIDWSHGEK